MLVDPAPPPGPTAAEVAASQALGRHSLLLGDCLAHLDAMPAASIDVVVTSPPYNIGVAYASYADRRPRVAYLAWLAEVGEALARVIRPEK